MGLAGKTESVETVREPFVDSALKVLYQLDLAQFEQDGYVNPDDVAVPTIESPQVGCDATSSIDIFKADVYLANQVSNYNRDKALEAFLAWSGYEALNSCTSTGLWSTTADICDLCP